MSVTPVNACLTDDLEEALRRDQRLSRPRCRRSAGVQSTPSSDGWL